MPGASHQGDRSSRSHAQKARGQILWSLPVQHPAEGEDEIPAIPNP